MVDPGGLRCACTGNIRLSNVNDCMKQLENESASEYELTSQFSVEAALLTGLAA